MMDMFYTWATGPVDRSGVAKYIHLIRGDDDPERPPRVKGANPNAWRDIGKILPGEWSGRILHLLGDGKTRTFNALCVELVGYTADMMHEEPLDHGLWMLVDDELVEHTTTAPILFRLASRN